MTTVSSFNMAKVLSDNKMICVLHKFYKLEDYEKNKEQLTQYYVPSFGGLQDDFDNSKRLYDIFNFKLISESACFYFFTSYFF
jgi:hypothetical protein